MHRQVSLIVFIVLGIERYAEQCQASGVVTSSLFTLQEVNPDSTCPQMITSHVKHRKNTKVRTYYILSRARKVGSPAKPLTPDGPDNQTL